jgi:hypothetical protein
MGAKPFCRSVFHRVAKLNSPLADLKVVYVLSKRACDMVVQRHPSFCIWWNVLHQDSQASIHVVCVVKPNDEGMVIKIEPRLCLSSKALGFLQTRGSIFGQYFQSVKFSVRCTFHQKHRTEPTLTEQLEKLVSTVNDIADTKDGRRLHLLNRSSRV